MVLCEVPLDRRTAEVSTAWNRRSDQSVKRKGSGGEYQDSSDRGHVSTGECEASTDIP